MEIKGEVKATKLSDGTNEVTPANAKDAVDKKHTQNTDTELDSGVVDVDASNNVTISQNSVVPFTSLASGAVANTLYLKEGKACIGGTNPIHKLDVRGIIRGVSSQSSAPLGSELVSNGTFDSDLTSWSGTNWAYDAGEASHTAGSTAALTQNITIANGTPYHITIKITDRTAGSVTLNINGVYIYSDGATKTFPSNTTYQRSLVGDASGSVTLSITPTTDFDGDIDDISVKAISNSTVNAVFVDDSNADAIEIRGDAGLNNIFIGLNSGRINTTGNSNSAMGYAALYLNTTGNYNSAIGHNALYSNTTGYNNSAMGRDALYSNTTGYHNSAMGRDALYSNTTGYHNSAMGLYALRLNTTGYHNSAMGMYALRLNTTGYDNSAMGYNALRSNTTGNYNSAIGLYAGRYIADGATGNTTGDYNVFLGYNTKALADNDQNEIVIGYNAVGVGSNSIVLGNDSITKTALKGNVGIGTSAFGTNATRTLALVNGTIPSSSPANAVQLYAEDVSSSSELKVRDEAGNITTLSPHNFSLFTPDPSYILPFSYYSKNEYIGKEINIDMYGAIKAIEELSGKKFIYTADITKRDWNKDQEAIKKAKDKEALAEALKEEVEITMTEAIEEVEIMKQVETSTKTKYKLNIETEQIETEETPVLEDKPTGKMKKQLKAGVRFDEETGKFYRKKTEEEVTIIPYKTKQPHQWIKKRKSNAK